MKAKKCRELGIDGELIELGEHTRTDELLALIAQLNHDNTVHGILVQLPLPAHVDTERILSAINPEKDVDGLHETNIGKLQKENTAVPIPCTALAVIEFLDIMTSTLKESTLL
ncbi:bifunctional protein FolD-like [Ylistrum balloti]|uniref:bifunctional protein FolD-like n=1 Tax=Ylistrum balloti TaxID=509963 RepID=UPI002905B99B|nr:bifunctional protein FolD-like [Ylistrum balloti]